MKKNCQANLEQKLGLNNTHTHKDTYQIQYQKVFKLLECLEKEEKDKTTKRQTNECVVCDDKFSNGSMAT